MFLLGNRIDGDFIILQNFMRQLKKMDWTWKRSSMYSWRGGFWRDLIFQEKKFPLQHHGLKNFILEICLSAGTLWKKWMTWEKAKFPSCMCLRNYFFLFTLFPFFRAKFIYSGWWFWARNCSSKYTISRQNCISEL